MLRRRLSEAATWIAGTWRVSRSQSGRPAPEGGSFRVARDPTKGVLGAVTSLRRQALVFSLLGFLLFYFPLAVLVVRFSRAMPLEGGIYQWIKVGGNNFVACLVGWNLWLFGVFNMSTTGLPSSRRL